MKTIFSNSVSELVKATGNILQGQRFDTPLAQDWIIVPNQDTGRWLQVKLTERLGALINIRIIILNEFTQAVAMPQHINNDACLYLAIAAHWSGERSAINPIDKVSEIDSLFQIYSNYLRYRPDWLVDWGEGGSEGLDQEYWQADLWREIKDFLPSPIHTAIWSLAKASDPLLLSQVSRILLFAPNRLSEITIKILDRLNQAHPLFCLTVNPSSSPWFLDGSSETDETHPLISDLCKEKQSVIKLLIEKDDDVIEGYVRPSAKTCLGKLQTSILNNSFTQQVKDESIVLVSAQTPTQEVEAVRDWIVNCLNSTPDLSLADVHLVTPNPGLYGPLVQRIFFNSDASQALPTAPDPVNSPDLISVCVHWIHNNFKTGFKASYCIDLLHQTEIKLALELSESEIRSICYWLKLSGARRSIDGHKHSLAAARKRLIRGLMVDPEQSLGSDAVISEPIENAHAINILLQIFDVVTNISKLPPIISVREFAMHLHDWIYQLTNGQILSLPLSNLPSKLLDKTLSTEVLFGFYRSFCGRNASRPLAVNDQISVTTPRTIHAISARVVAILGANDGTIPDEYLSHPWNLMTRQPRVGDENLADADRQVFFDIVSNTQNAIWVSWIGEHPATLKKELPASSVNSLLNCIKDGHHTPVELHTSREISDFATSRATTAHELAPPEQPERKINWHVTDLLNAIENPAKWFIEQRGARVYYPRDDVLNFEPITISSLDKYNLRDRARTGIDRDSIIKLLTAHPEMPETLFLEQIITQIAPSNVIKVAQRCMTYSDLGILNVGDYSITLNRMRDPTIPWIVIDSQNKNQRFLRAMIECLVHFAAETATSDIHLLTFNNKAYPIRSMPAEEAQQLLKKWLDEFSQISQRPSYLISPLAISHAEAFNTGKQKKFRIHWRDQTLIHKSEYRRLLSNRPTIHDDYSRLVEVLVAVLIKQRGKGSASL